MRNLNTILTLILISSTVFGFSQENQKKKTNIGFFFAPAYTYRVLSSKSQKEIYDESYMRYRDVTESATKSKAENNRKIPVDFKIGLSVDYSISDKTSIGSGIVFENYGYERFASAAWKYGDMIHTDELYNYEYSFLSVPVIFNYKIEGRKMLFSGGAGLIQSVLVNKDEDTDSNPLWGEVTSTKTNTYNISPVIKLGMDYKISKRLSIFCEPQFSIMLLPFKTENVISTYYDTETASVQNKEGKIKERLYSLSLSLGVRL